MAKWSKIIQFLLLLVGVTYHDDLFSKLNKNYALSTSPSMSASKQDPQQWYQKMMQKYPDAGLEHAEFVAGSHWAMGPRLNDSACIFCPSDKFNGYQPFTPDDEISLLHEAGHVRNHSWTKLFYENKRQLALTTALVAVCFLGSGGITKSKNLAFESAQNLKDHKVVDVISKIFLFSCAYSFLFTSIYAVTPPVLQRIDETLADNFANQHGDEQALKEGYKFYMNHADFQKSVYKNWYFRWIHDFAHPASSDRAQAIRKVLMSKFCTLPPMIA
jgi:hypothetical protein